MKFEEMVSALREGKKVRLKEWKEIQYIYMPKNETELRAENGHFVNLSWKNFFSDDWEIVEEPKKVKLRDMTEKEFRNWKNEKCEADCKHCIFEKVGCAEWKNNCWVRNKNLYSNRFLDQEIEIEVKNEPLLTKKEKEYLEAVIKPFKDKVKSVEKMSIATVDGIEHTCICIRMSDGKNESTFSLPYFVADKYYNGLRSNKSYTLEDLGLFQENKYKITLSEFWSSKDKLAIHCNTREKADKFLKESNKTGKWGDFGSCYGVYREKTCYCNESNYDELEYYIVNNYTIYEFEDVDLED